jgi:ATP-dependent DNA helicase RecQ
MPTSSGHRAQLRRTAAEKFGWSSLREEQLAAMEAVLSGHDVLAVLPTGAGKSAIYQVPAVLLDGPTVVVSPLISLQNDQIDGLEDSGAPAAVALNSAQRAEERRHAWDALRHGGARYVFVAPEQLAGDEVVAVLEKAKVSLFVVDEAHCVSSWGHEFRPDYLRLGAVLDRLGHPRTVALTATAAPPVRRDIVARLGLREHREVIASFDRPNLRLAVERFTADAGKRAGVVAYLGERVADPATRRGLVYTASRKDAEHYADELVRTGARAAAYHAGMAAADRDRVHQAFLDDDVDVVVATSAFGMGIDKPDVRFVVHTSVPDSLDSYYQQVGRAGRDGEPAGVTLFYRPEDLNLQTFLTAAKAPEDTLRDVARVLERRGEPISPGELKEAVDAPPARLTRAVNLLEEVGVVTTTESGALVPAADLDPDRAVAEAVAAAQAWQRLIRSRIEMMRGYAETTGCRRQNLLGYFGEQLEDPCGFCDTCDAGTARPRPAEDPGEFPVDSRVRHGEWGAGTVMSVEDDRITVLFDEHGYKSLSLPLVRDKDLLSADIREA